MKLLKKPIIEKFAPTRAMYTFTDKTHVGGKFIVELSKVEHSHKGNCLAKLWQKNGFTEKLYKTHWSVSTYAYDEKGNCWGYYNPLIKNRKINFEWLLEATEENKIKIINEALRRAYN